MATEYTRKFEVRICKCGCIHFIPWKDIEDAIDQNKEFVVICNRCGTAVRYGADDYYFDELGDGKALYCYPLDKGEITKERFDTEFTKILYNEGVRVPMRTGQLADFYDGNTFYDTQPHFWSSKLYECKTIEEVRDYYQKMNELAKQVNIDSLMDKLDDDKRECLSHYYIKALVKENEDA